MQFVKEFYGLDTGPLCAQLSQCDKPLEPSPLYSPARGERFIDESLRTSRYRTVSDTAVLDAADRLLAEASAGDPVNRYVLVRNDVTHIVYSAGGFFKRHRDFVTMTSNVVEEYTMIVCITPPALAAQCQGGETRIHVNADWTHTSRATVVPGGALLFRKDIDHEGLPVVAGEKHVATLNVWAMRRSHPSVLIVRFQSTQPPSRLSSTAELSERKHTTVAPEEDDPPRSSPSTLSTATPAAMSVPMPVVSVSASAPRLTDLANEQCYALSLTTLAAFPDCLLSRYCSFARLSTSTAVAADEAAAGGAVHYYDCEQASYEEFETVFRVLCGLSVSPREVIERGQLLDYFGLGPQHTLIDLAQLGARPVLPALAPLPARTTHAASATLDDETGLGTSIAADTAAAALPSGADGDTDGHDSDHDAAPEPAATDPEEPTDDADAGAEDDQQQQDDQAALGANADPGHDQEIADGVSENHDPEDGDAEHVAASAVHDAAEHKATDSDQDHDAVDLDQEHKATDSDQNHEATDSAQAMESDKDASWDEQDDDGELTVAGSRPVRMGLGGEACCSKCQRPASLLSTGILMVCTRCRSAQYCDRRCQRAHWLEHQSTCTTPAVAAGFRPAKQADALIVLCCSDERTRSLVGVVRQLKLPYVRFRVVFAEGTMTFGGGYPGKDPFPVRMQPVWASFGDHDNLFLVRGVINLFREADDLDVATRLRTCLRAGERATLDSEWDTDETERDTVDEHGVRHLIFDAESEGRDGTHCFGLLAALDWAAMDRDNDNDNDNDNKGSSSSSGKSTMADVEALVSTKLCNETNVMSLPVVMLPGIAAAGPPAEQGGSLPRDLPGQSVGLKISVPRPAGTEAPPADAKYFGYDDRGRTCFTDQQAAAATELIDEEDVIDQIRARLGSVSFQLPQLHDTVNHSFCNESVYGNFTFVMATGFVRLVQPPATDSDDEDD